VPDPAGPAIQAAGAFQSAAKAQNGLFGVVLTALREARAVGGDARRTGTDAGHEV